MKRNFPDRSPIRTVGDIEAIEGARPFTARYDHRSTLDVLAAAVHRDPDSIAILFLRDGSASSPPVTVTYKELLQKVIATANVLDSLGIRAGDVASYVLPNLPETHYINIGAQTAGISNPVNPLLSAVQISEILRAANTSVLFAYADDDDAWTKAEQVRELTPTLKHLIAVGVTPRSGAHLFEELLAREENTTRIISRDIDPEDVASYFHTGGTTGAPKLAKHLHRNQLFEAWAFAYLTDLQPSDRFCVGLPLFHVHAVIPNSLAVFFAGATQILLSPAGYRNPKVIEEFWQIVKIHRATAFSAVPTVYSALMAKGIDADAAASLRYCICGSAPLAIEQVKRFRELTGVSILEGYGLTEGTCVSSLGPSDGERRPGSIGLRVPYQEMKIVRFVDGGMNDCATGEAGHLVIRGPNVFSGYCNETNNEGVLLEGGWLDTGDLGRCDEEGYFWLTGRAKDVIKRSGHTIDPQIIEECLFAHPAVAIAAAVGRPDAYAGELPVCYVVLKPDVSVTSEDLRLFARDTIADRAAAPFEVIVVDAIPLTAVGKVYKPELRALEAGAAIANALSEYSNRFRVEMRRDASNGVAFLVTVNSAQFVEPVDRILSSLMLNHDIQIVEGEE